MVTVTFSPNLLEGRLGWDLEADAEGDEVRCFDPEGSRLDIVGRALAPRDDRSPSPVPSHENVRLVLWYMNLFPAMPTTTSIFISSPWLGKNSSSFFLVIILPVRSLPHMDDDPLVVPFWDGVDRSLHGREVPFAIDVDLDRPVGSDLLGQ